MCVLKSQPGELKRVKVNYSPLPMKDGVLTEGQTMMAGEYIETEKIR
jgi:hypothetical protein